MCIEHCVLWKGEMVYNDVMIHCGHTEVTFQKCAKARALFSRFSKHIGRDGLCKDTKQFATELRSLCPKCTARGDEDPFYLLHMQEEPEHRMRNRISPVSPPREATSTVPTQTAQLEQHLAMLPRPNTSYHRTDRLHDSPAQSGYRPTASRSLTLPTPSNGLQRSNAIRRPASRARAPSTSPDLPLISTDLTLWSSPFD